MKLVLAEKPSVGKEFAKILGADKTHDGYMEGNDWVVTWGFGHLIELEDPDFYLEEEKRGKWKREQLPILVDEFVFRVKTTVNKTTHKTEIDAGVKKQLNTIRNLVRRTDIEYLVNGTDAGREGEAIFRYIYNFLGITKPVKRLWTSSLTETALREAFGNLKDSSDYDNLFSAALCRNEADWLVGMNATRAMTIAAGIGEPLSVGRVQTPTMAMICERYEQFKNFKPTPYYVVKLEFTCANGEKFNVSLPEKFEERSKAEEYIKTLPQLWTVSQKEEKEVKEKAPLPFCIDDVQIRANQLYGMKAQLTLDCVQSLYEAKMVTYPRTGSRYLGEDMITLVGDSVSKLSQLGYSLKFVEACGQITSTNINRAMFDSSKLTDHHAIIPTFENLKSKVEEFSSLASRGISAEDLKRVYDLIVKQLVMASMPVCIKNKLTYTLRGGETEVSVSGFTIKSEGWRSILGKEVNEDEKEEDNQKLPSLKEGDSCEIANLAIDNKETTPEPLLTEATLLKLMEGAGKLIDTENKDLKKAIKDCGIGTPATRAAAIETLFQRQYVRSEGKKLIPTDKGLDFYHVVKNEDVAKVEMTAEWEQKLKMIEEGSYSSKVFMDEITDYTKDIVDSLLEVDGDAIRKNAPVTAGKCPLCGGDVIEKEKFFICQNRKKDDPESCRFFINKSFLPYKDAKALKLKKKDCLNLINLKETSEYQVEVKPGEVKSKKFRYDTEEKRVKYVVPKRTETAIVCPKCGGKIIETDKQFKCENNNYLEENSCPICLFKDTKMGITLTEKMVTVLLSGQKLEKVNLTAKSGTKYEGTLYYDFEKNGIRRYSELKDTGIVCPKCGGKIIETERNFHCENNTYGDDTSCPISFYKDQGTILTVGLVKTLLEGKITDFIELKGRYGEYKCALKYNPDTNKIEKVFPEKQQKETGLICPMCGGHILLEDNKRYRCERYKYNDPNACQFSTLSTIASKEITAEILKELLDKGETDKLDGFKSKGGKDFQAKLILNKNKIEFKFD